MNSEENPISTRLNKKLMIIILAVIAIIAITTTFVIISMPTGSGG